MVLDPLAQLSWPMWSLLALGALLAGFGKTAVGAAVTVAVAIFALVLPSRESTGILLVLLMAGDLIAVTSYRRTADWALLGRLVVPVLAGIAAGGLFLAVAPVGWMRVVIGAVVTVLALIEIGQRLRLLPAGRHSGAETAVSRSGFGVLAGFTTMVANAGGPVMSVHLLRARLGVRGFVGTLAWFFLAVNLLKLPVSLGLGLIAPARFGLILSLVPAVLIGAVLGRLLIARIPRGGFEWTIRFLTVASGLLLMFG